MKKHSILILLLMNSFLSAQVAIGKENVEGASTLLDFESGSDNYRGIILPAVDDLSAALASEPTHNNGTFLFDKSDNKIKMYEKGIWVALSDEGNSAALLVNENEESAENNGVIIGAETSSSKGVMVLESEDKALVLPKIANPHLTVKSPYPGMICYDTESKSLALFDGAVWNYWK